MTSILVTLGVILLLAGCAEQKTAAPANTPPSAQSPTPAPAAPAPSPAPGPPAVASPMVTAPGAPAAPAAEPRPPAAGQAPAPPPQILYVKVHLANFREGVGTSRRILRVLPQGARLQLLESRASWLRVRLDDGQEGWIAESVTSATAPVTPTRTPAPRRSRPPQIARA